MRMTQERMRTKAVLGDVLHGAALARDVASDIAELANDLPDREGHTSLDRLRVIAACVTIQQAADRITRIARGLDD